jgi:flavin reductase (DIM6/NTAB) family NADH-FMN oxidoreductase RutF
LEKIKLGSNTYLFPMPAVLVGATVEGKPNFMLVAYCGIVAGTPRTISIGLGKRQLTAEGIREHGTFSVNIPTTEMAPICDYVGIHSGRSVDKTTLFEVFYGELETAPMVTECPLNLECRVTRTLEFPKNHLFFGEIVETYVQKECLTGDRPDIEKLKPFLFSVGDRHYYEIGKQIGKAWKIGKDYTPP